MTLQLAYLNIYKQDLTLYFFPIFAQSAGQKASSYQLHDYPILIFAAG